MNQTKLQTALIVGMLFFCSPSLFAAGSPSSPVSGNYVSTQTEFCASANAALSPRPTRYKENVGLLFFTPEPTSTYNIWMPRVSIANSIASRAYPSLTNTLTDSTNSQVFLKETPIQWGTINWTYRSLDFDSSSTTAPTQTNKASIIYSFITSYQFAVPANMNGITTGYAVYFIRNTNGHNEWHRERIFLNNAPNTSTNFALPLTQPQTELINNINTTFNCIGVIKASR